MALRKWRDALLGVIFIALAVVLYVGAAQLPPNLLGGMGPDFMPKVVAIGMGILGILQLVSGIRQPAAESSQGEDTEDGPEYWRVGLTVLCFGIYVFSMQAVGFLVCSAIYLFAQMMILSPREKRNPLRFAIIAVLFTVAAYFIFRNGLNVMLPRGILG